MTGGFAGERGRNWALVTLCTVLFLTFLDNTIVSVTLADIQTTLHEGVTQLQWVVNGYALAFASLMLAGGWLGDQYGRKRVMLGGVAVFCVGSVVCALAPNAGTLIGGRVVMGIGAAASEPGTLSILRQIYPDARSRARALGAWAAVSGFALAMGPVVGGTIVGISGWREVFWFNLAFGALIFVAAVLTLEESADPVRSRLDWPGLVAGVLGLALLIFAVIQGELSGYGSAGVLAMFVVGALSLAAFVVIELRSDHPVLDVRFFRVPTFTGATFAAFATYFGVFAIFFFTALYLQVIAGFSGYRTAAQFGAMTLAMIVAAAVSGPWVARVGPRIPLVLGCLFAGAGMLVTNAILAPNVGFAPLALALVLVGIGFGLAVVPVTSSVLTVVPARRSGMAASAANTSRELGAVFGVAILGSVINAQLSSQLVVQLTKLGIPAQFQTIVLNAVEKGSLPAASQSGATAKAVAAGGAAAAGHASLVQKVIDAAYGAFYAGLDIAMLLSAALILAAGVLAAFTVHSQPADFERLTADDPEVPAGVMG